MYRREKCRGSGNYSFPTWNFPTKGNKREERRRGRQGRSSRRYRCLRKRTRRTEAAEAAERIERGGTFTQNSLGDSVIGLPGKWLLLTATSRSKVSALTPDNDRGFQDFHPLNPIPDNRSRIRAWKSLTQECVPSSIPDLCVFHTLDRSILESVGVLNVYKPLVLHQTPSILLESLPVPLDAGRDLLWLDCTWSLVSTIMTEPRTLTANTPEVLTSSGLPGYLIYHSTDRDLT